MDVKKIHDFKAGAKWKGYELGPVVSRGRLILAGARSWVLPGVHFISRNTSAFLVDVAYMEPFIISHPVTLDGIGMEVVTAGDIAALMKVAIYKADANWQPGALVTAPSSTMAVGTTGQKSITGIGLSLDPGRYLKLHKHNSTLSPVLRWCKGSISNTQIVPAYGASPFINELRRAQAYTSAWPDPFLAPTSVTATDIGWAHVLYLDLSVVT